MFGPTARADSPAPAEATPEFERYGPSELAREIGQAEDFFRWFELRESVLRRRLDHPEVDKALLDAEKRLLTHHPPQPIHEKLELVGFRWWIHSMRTDGLARYRANWIFRVSDKIELEEGDSLRLILDARPKPDHAHLLVYEREREQGTLQGTLRLDPPIGEWEPGSYHFLRTPFAAPLVPFRMETYFIRKNGDRILGQWGRRIDLGWYVNFPE